MLSFCGACVCTLRCHFVFCFVFSKTIIIKIPIRKITYCEYSPWPLFPLETFIFTMEFFTI